MKDSEIVETVRFIRRLQVDHPTGVKRAIIEGLFLRMEDHGVTAHDLDRLGLQ